MFWLCKCSRWYYFFFVLVGVKYKGEWFIENWGIGGRELIVLCFE